MQLCRTSFEDYGIFGYLIFQGQRIAYTLEHAYYLGGEWLPKIPHGHFLCVRGRHQLAGMMTQFETFEVTGVFGHEGLLFHVGNKNEDSRGCILIGESIEDKTLCHSVIAFDGFMDLLKGINEFSLWVS